MQSPSRPKPVTAGELEKLAQESAAEKDWDTAADEFRRAIELDPRSVRLRIELGDSLAAAEDFPGAIAAYSDALRLDARNEAGELGLAEAFRRVSNYDEARREIERATHDHPESSASRRALERLEIERQQHERGADDNSVVANRQLQEAGELAKKNQFAQAIELLHQVLKNDPANPAANALFAKALYSIGEFARAGEAIEKSLAARPDNPGYLYIHGKILEKEHRAEEALQTFEKIALVNPKESDAWFEIGAIHQQLGERKQAQQAYRKAVELSPDDPAYRKALESVSGSGSGESP
jgi:tetratricopeptide (TPR) repeat protein